MTSGDEYRCKALELCVRANEERKLEVRREFESLAMACMRLAEMAERNTLLDPTIRRSAHSDLHSRPVHRREFDILAVRPRRRCEWKLAPRLGFRSSAFPTHLTV